MQTTRLRVVGVLEQFPWDRLGVVTRPEGVPQVLDDRERRVAQALVCHRRVSGVAGPRAGIRWLARPADQLGGMGPEPHAPLFYRDVEAGATNVPWCKR